MQSQPKPKRMETSKRNRMNHLSRGYLFTSSNPSFRARSIVYNCTDYFTSESVVNAASHPTVGNGRKNTSKLHVFMREFSFVFRFLLSV